MSFVDKIKNALFEVEYVVDDKEKENEEKKEEPKENKDKPIAKRVILSGHRRDKHKENVENNDENPVVEENKGEEHNDVEILTETPKQPDFKVMNDNDFKVEEFPPEPEVIRQPEPTYEREAVVQEETPKVEERVIYRQEVREKSPYGIDEASKNLVQEYGRAYEKKEERGGFKPSPIISPIYGVLDKNYRKEDVREKRDVRLTSYSRDSINVDDVRNKAYAKAEEKSIKPVKEIEKLEPEEAKPVFEEDDDDSNLLVDLSKDNDKPSVKEVTMGDALEYFQDLGLEYNVDYVDASKERASGRRVRENYDDNSEMFSIQDKKEEPVVESIPKVEDKPPVINNSNDIDVENDDNLFDLIDSMYDEEK